MIFVY